MIFSAEKLGRLNYRTTLFAWLAVSVELHLWYTNGRTVIQTRPQPMMMFLVHSHQCHDYTLVTLRDWSVKIPDVGDSIQLPVSITKFRTIEPNSETGRSRSPVRKRETTYHNHSAQLTV